MKTLAFNLQKTSSGENTLMVYGGRQEQLLGGPLLADSVQPTVNTSAHLPRHPIAASNGRVATQAYTGVCVRACVVVAQCYGKVVKHAQQHV